MHIIKDEAFASLAEHFPNLWLDASSLLDLDGLLAGRLIELLSQFLLGRLEGNLAAFKRRGVASINDTIAAQPFTIDMR